MLQIRHLCGIDGRWAECAQPCVLISGLPEKSYCSYSTHQVWVFPGVECAR